MKICSFFYVWVGKYYKTLHDWSHGKQWILFPFDLNFPRRFASGNIRVLKETRLTVSLKESNYVLIVLDNL